MTSPQTFQCTAFSVYQGSVIKEQRHATLGSEQTDPPIQIRPGMGDKGSALAVIYPSPLPMALYLVCPELHSVELLLR